MLQGSISFTEVNINVPFKWYLRNLAESLEKSSRAKSEASKEKRVEQSVEKLQVEADSSSGAAIETQTDQSELTAEKNSSPVPILDLRSNISCYNIAVGEANLKHYQEAKLSPQHVAPRKEATANISFSHSPADHKFFSRMWFSETSKPRKNICSATFTQHQYTSHLSLTPSPQTGYPMVQGWPSRHQYLLTRQQDHDARLSSRAYGRFGTDRGSFRTDRQPWCVPPGHSQRREPPSYAKEPSQRHDEPKIPRGLERCGISSDHNPQPSLISSIEDMSVPVKKVKELHTKRAWFSEHNFLNCPPPFRHSSEQNPQFGLMKQHSSCGSDWHKTSGRWSSALASTAANKMASERTEPVRKYKCDVCEKAFSRSNTLVTHRRIHTGDKPFCCDVCGRAFRQPGNLTRHRLTHTAYKPFACHVCSKAFNRSSNLSTHMKTHTRSELGRPQRHTLQMNWKDLEDTQ